MELKSDTLAFDKSSFFYYAFKQVERLKELGCIRRSETRLSSLRSFMRFRRSEDISFERFDKNLMEHFEAWLKADGVSRNTSSFYMRNLRSIYIAAVEDGITPDLKPFGRVYTGVDKTLKRALSQHEMHRIIGLDLTCRPALGFARDMLMFSFYARGMSFVDMAYLRKRDWTGSHIVYRRHKTAQLLVVEMTPQMKRILSRYPSTTQYMLPLILREDGSERDQYRNMLIRVNRNLKKVGEMARLHLPLSTYVARHSWATIARDRDVPLSVISEGLGHDNEQTTRIYINSIYSSKVDQANRMIIENL